MPIKPNTIKVEPPTPSSPKQPLQKAPLPSANVNDHYQKIGTTKLENLIQSIPDTQLRRQIAQEVAKLKSTKKFGLVFEEHAPEIVQLPGLEVKLKAQVIKRNGKKDKIYKVVDSMSNSKFRIVRESDGSVEVVSDKELVVIKRFGEPIYPTLIPVDRITRAPDKHYHTIINADNFHALQLLLYCYERQVDVIYIDPPYNTGACDWKYNNNYVDKKDQYRHSKWLSMMKKRLILAKRLLRADGVLIVTIDDYELFHLGNLLEQLYPTYDIFIVTIEHNKRGRRGKNFAKSNEWAVFLVPKKLDIIQEERTSKPIGGETRNLRRTGSGSKRHERWRKFYPIWVNQRTLEIVSAGDPIPKDAAWEVSKKEDLITIWPVDKDGKEKNWHYGVERTRNCIKEEKLDARIQNYGIQIYYTLREKSSKKYKTVWSRPSLDASTYGSELLNKILKDKGEFNYPKSLYAVLECLRASIGQKSDGLILDFFAGSGTTLHATSLLNGEDGGNRRCILVTNNEVDEKLTKKLNKKGIWPGDPKFEEHGICESITWPRCKYVVNGKRDDGTELSGKYLNGREMKEGFEENIEYFKLCFLDPNEVAYGEKFEAILPILWLVSGALGKRETARGYGKWFIPKESPFAVLIQENHFAQFKRELKRREDIKYVFLVTDSEEAYREMVEELPGSPKTKMLYKNYLDNFSINTEKNL